MAAPERSYYLNLKKFAIGANDKQPKFYSDDQKCPCRADATWVSCGIGLGLAQRYRSIN
jgi:hypothetical protein